MHHSGLLFIQRHHVSHLLYVFPEVPFVKFFIQYHFIQSLQLSQGEFLRKQLKTDVLAFQLLFEGLKCLIQNIVSEMKLGNAVLVHCNAGLGRSGLVASILLKEMVIQV